MISVLFSSAVLSLTVKFASIAPEGSYWYDMAMRIKKALKGKKDINVVVYSGTSMGDEVDIVRKIRIGQLHAAGLTSHGLEYLSPEIRAYDLPFVFESYEEFAEVRDRLFPELARRYERKGIVLLSHFTIGFIYVFSRKEEIWGSNLWVWVGDILAKAQAQELGGLFKIIPLQVSDVLQALATGMVDSVFNSFYALHALQWSNFIKSYIPLPLYIYSAGVIVRKDIWEKIPEKQREEAKKKIWESSINIEKYVLKLNRETRKKLKGRVKEMNDPEKIKELKKASLRIRERVLQMSPEIREFYNLIERTLAEIRKSKKMKGEARRENTGKSGI